MNRARQIGSRALLVAWAIAGWRAASPAGDDAAAAAQLKDACALLAPADIQALDPQAKIPQGEPTSGAPLATGCEYRWGPSTKEWGQTFLTLALIDASRVWPGGLTADDIRQRVEVEVGMGGPGSARISGIGDGALFTTDANHHDAAAKGYFVKAKGVVLTVSYHGGDPGAQKDKLVALLKTAAAAL
ncbi:MAG: hypothetical protein U0X73_17655 [Thermoanaerobaculia bacterium]